MLMQANAKINLSLDVLGTLPDGYHTVRMVMQSVGLHDILDIRENTGDSIILTCDNNALPCDSSNLIVRAAEALFSAVGYSTGISIELKKNIPMAAGLAGGSADAAAALVGINELLGLRLDTESLMDIGGRLGADIPFCIHGGTCLAEGIGELLTPVSAMPDCHIVLFKPPFDVSTKYVYDNLILNEDTVHPDTDAVMGALAADDLTELAASIGNILEAVTVQRYPEIARVKEVLIGAGALGALMSGSGPTVYGICRDEETAGRVMADAKTFANEAGMAGASIQMCRPASQGVRILG